MAEDAIRYEVALRDGDYYYPAYYPKGSIRARIGGGWGIDDEPELLICRRMARD